MSTFPIIAVSIGVVIVLLLAVMLVIYRRKGRCQNQITGVFFILGIVWLPLGIALKNPSFWGMAAVFLVVGLANRDKWKGRKS